MMFKKYGDSLIVDLDEVVAVSAFDREGQVHLANGSCVKCGLNPAQRLLRDVAVLRGVENGPSKADNLPASV